MNKDLKNLKEIVEDLEDAQDGAIISLKQSEIESLKNIYNLIEIALKEIKELKEKNKTLEALLQGNLYELYLYYKELASKYQANSISKDKIREKIKELENDTTNKFLFELSSADIRNSIAFNLKELLEE